MKGIRFKTANRAQIRMEVLDFEQLIAADHLARVVVAYVDEMNLDDFYRDILSVDGQAGRPACDPKVLLSLWIYATLVGVGSARCLARMCETDHACRWICGGMNVNYHTLSDFRMDYENLLDRLFTQTITAFASKQLVNLDRIIIDGTKVGANASKKSFKNGERLCHIQNLSEQHVSRLKAELKIDSESSTRRVQAAAVRAGNEIIEKAKAALAVLPQIAKAKAETQKKMKKGTKVSEATASTSDADARFMRFSNGAIRPGYNAQLAIDPDSFMIVGLDVTNKRNDLGQLPPMLDQHQERYGISPKIVIVDKGYQVEKEIIQLCSEASPTKLYSPAPKLRTDVKPESVRKRRKVSDKIAEWRDDMKSEAAKQQLRLRKHIETVNAIIHNRLGKRFMLRARSKTRCELLLQALAHNIFRANKLQLA